MREEIFVAELSYGLAMGS